MFFLCFATGKKTKIVVLVVGAFDEREGGRVAALRFLLFRASWVATGIGSRWGYCAAGA